MGTQDTSNYAETGEAKMKSLNGVVCRDNVIIAAQNLVELFYTHIVPSEDGLGRNKITNAVVTGNYAAYLGYGYPNIVDNDTEGLALHNWFYGEMVNCVFADNTMVYCEGSIIGAHVGSDSNPRGWYMYGNTYVLNPDLCAMLRGKDGVTYTNLEKSFYGAYKMSYTERSVTHLASIGIDSDSEFYRFDYMTEGEKLGAYVTTGWRVEHWYDPS